MAGCALQRHLMIKLRHARVASILSIYDAPLTFSSARRCSDLTFFKRTSSTTSTSSSSPPPDDNSQAFTKWEQWLHAPYPHELIEINNKALRGEIFRKDITMHTSNTKDVPLPFHHHRLERRGDCLAYLIADQVASQYFAQVSQEERLLSSKVHSATAILVSNKHWTLLTRQFKLGPAGHDLKPPAIQSRLADNFEVYIYGLFLDRGFDTVAQLLAPVFLKYLFEYAPPPDCTVRSKEFLRKGPTQHALKKGIEHSDSAVLRPMPMRKQRGAFSVPDWVVACSEGAACNRSGCYFAHPDAHGQWSQWKETTDPPTIKQIENNDENDTAGATSLSEASKASPSECGHPLNTDTPDSASSKGEDTAFNALNSEQQELQQLKMRVESLESAIGPLMRYVNAQIVIAAREEEEAQAIARKSAEEQRAKAARKAENKAQAKAAKETKDEKDREKAQAKAQARLKKQQEQEKRAALKKAKAKEKADKDAKEKKEKKDKDGKETALEAEKRERELAKQLQIEDTKQEK